MDKKLFTTLLGSGLYGTSKEGVSDKDYGEVFLPCLKKMMLGGLLAVVQQSTSDVEHKNTADDVDVMLYPVQLLAVNYAYGDYNAVQLVNQILYGQGHADYRLESQELYDLCIMLKRHYSKYEKSAMFNFAASLYKRFRFVGDSDSVLHKLVNVFDGIAGADKSKESFESIFDKIEPLIQEFGEDKVCLKINFDGKNHINTMYLLGKMYLGTIAIEEAYRLIKNRLKKQISFSHKRQIFQYTKEDWKTLYQSMRGFAQLDMLIETGKIQYPISGYWLDLIMKVRNQEMSFEEIYQKLSKIEDELSAKFDLYTDFFLGDEGDSLLKEKVTEVVWKMYGF